MAIEIERAAKALIRRRIDGKYLILTCSLWPENPRRSQKPDLPGGVIELGESIEGGLLREVREEAGLDLTLESLSLGHCFSYFDGELSSNFLVYTAEVEGDEEIILSWEHESYQWMTVDEVLSLEIRQPYPEVFQYLSKIELLK